MMVRFRHKGNFSKIKRFFAENVDLVKKLNLDEYAQLGVAALASATPLRSGETAGSWYYEIEKTGTSAVINFLNSNINDGVPIAIILQYGHGTGTGGYVQGQDYINPAIRPIFEEMADQIWREVTRS